MYTPDENLVVAYVTSELKKKYGDSFNPEQEIPAEDQKILSEQLASMDETQWNEFAQSLEEAEVRSAKMGAKLSYIKTLKKGGTTDKKRPTLNKAEASTNSLESWVKTAAIIGVKSPTNFLQSTKPNSTFLKKGGKAKKKCKCGCDIMIKREGGKLVEGCACGCKTKEIGGLVEKDKCGGKTKKLKAKVAKSEEGGTTKKYLEMASMKAKLKCGGKPKLKVKSKK